METLQQTPTAELTSSQFNTLIDDVTNELWDLRSQDEYFNKYEKFSAARPDLSKDELEAFIMKNTAKAYAAKFGFDSTKTAAFTLIAAAPDYAINQARKDIYGANDKNLRAVSEFNGLVRDLVTLHPEIDQDSLSARLVESVSATGIDNEFTSDAELRGAMDATITGARTEAGLEQLFTHADISFRRGTTVEDLQHIDYIVPVPKKTLKIDVKSSVKGTGSDTNIYQRVGENHYKLLRLFGAGDFQANSFKLRPQSLEDKTPGTQALIDTLAKLG